MKTINFKNFRKFTNLNILKSFCEKIKIKNDKKFLIGINIFDDPRYIKLGLIDLEGKVIAKENIYCEGLNFTDVNYLTKIRANKIKDICKIENYIF